MELYHGMTISEYARVNTFPRGNTFTLHVLPDIQSGAQVEPVQTGSEWQYCEELSPVELGFGQCAHLFGTTGVWRNSEEKDQLSMKDNQLCQYLMFSIHKMLMIWSPYPVILSWSQLMIEHTELLKYPV